MLKNLTRGLRHTTHRQGLAIYSVLNNIFDNDSKSHQTLIFHNNVWISLLGGSISYPPRLTPNTSLTPPRWPSRYSEWPSQDCYDSSKDKSTYRGLQISPWTSSCVFQCPTKNVFVYNITFEALVKYCWQDPAVKCFMDFYFFVVCFRTF